MDDPSVHATRESAEIWREREANELGYELSPSGENDGFEIEEEEVQNLF